MRLCFTIVVVLLTMSFANADGIRLVPESQRTRERLDEGAEFERQQKGTEALECYLKLLADVPDEWVPSADGSVLRPCRQVTLSRIAANPQTRAAYRTRFEAAAQTAQRVAAEKRDSTDLERVVANYWPSQAAATAMDILGDLAFERGQLADSIHWWRLLSGPHRIGEPVFPDPQGDIARVRAKYLIARRMLGDSVDAELESFRREYPEARGLLAGRDDLLAGLASKVLKDGGAILPRIEPARVTTFAANSARIGATSQRLPELAPRRIERPIEWPSGEVQPEAALPERNPIASPRHLTVHPLVWSGKLIAGDGERIFAFQLETGLIADVFGPPGRLDQPVAEPQTLALHGQRVYARLNPTTIVALERDLAAERWVWKKVWELKSTSLSDNAVFEGCPTIADGRLYASWSATNGNRSIVTLGCFALDRSNEGPLWNTTVAEVPLDRDARKPRTVLLALAGPNIIYGTDAGAVISLEARTGKPAWAAKYPSRGPRGLPANLLPVPRDLCPPVYADGRIFLAPSDTDEIIALDARTGVRIWQQPRVLEVVHLLGVIDNKLIITAEGQYQGIGAIDAASGQIDLQWGNLRSAAPFGRGLIAKDFVLFPTRNNGLLVLDRDGHPVFGPAMFQNVPGGNLAWEEDTLVVATADHLLRLGYSGPAPRRSLTP